MKYSIITINYNNRDGLERTIQSVINQTCQDFEYIIIDGGSTDGSVDVIKKYADRIDYWVSEPDKGIYNAMNKGILQAHGEYLNFMNSGDCFFDDKVLHKVLSSSGDIILGSVFRNDINKIVRPSIKESLYSLFLSDYNHQSTFFHRNLFDSNKYDESLKIVSDWKFILQCALFYNAAIVIIDIVVAKYEDAGVSSNMNQVRNERIKVLYEILPQFVAKDYEIMMNISPSIYKSLKVISVGYRMNKLTAIILKVIAFIYGLYKK